MINYDDEVGRQLRIERERIGLTAEEVATRMGVVRSTVTYWETNKRSISAKCFFQYCEVIGADPEEIIRRVKRHI